MKRKSAKKPKQLYGIAEWYGHLYRSLDHTARLALADTSEKRICPFIAQVPSLGPKNGNLNCNKPGGVCSLRNFHEPDSEGDLSFGPITVTCPNRFLEQGVVVRHVAGLLLKTDSPRFAKELPFLKRPRSAVAQQAIEETEREESTTPDVKGGANAEDVGRIDLVFVHPDDISEWCAVELQAVYFSGGEMSKDYAVIKSFSGNGIPMPGVARRPDFRSSGPKRLMPQLMIKVPSLRRWGKKMVVVIDQPFFDAMDHMEEADDVSNADIVWVVAEIDDSAGYGSGELKIARTVLTTLEDAVKGLTAGRPTTKLAFESRLAAKIANVFSAASAE